MTRAVSNTSPLRYLIAAGYVDLLAGLFGGIMIPPGVAAELSNVITPSKVRAWIAQPPSWLRLHTLNAVPDSELMIALDLGEREAIQLATEQEANILIMDEWNGRAIAQRRGLPLTGTLGILGDAYRRGLIDHPMVALSEIRQHGFYINDSLAASLRLFCPRVTPASALGES